MQERLRSALTMLGIVIGVAAVLAMLAIGDGAKRIVTQEFEKFGGHFTVRRNPWIWRGDRVFPNRSSEHLKYEDVLAIEAECPSVESAIPLVLLLLCLRKRKPGQQNGRNVMASILTFRQGCSGRFNRDVSFSEDDFNNRRKSLCAWLRSHNRTFWRSESDRQRNQTFTTRRKTLTVSAF